MNDDIKLRLQFVYCHPWNFDCIVDGIDSMTKPTRVCYVQSPARRVCLVVSSASTEYQSWVQEENKWVQVTQKVSTGLPDDGMFFDSEEQMKQALRTVFMKQFPEAYELTFHYMPSSKHVEAYLSEGHTLSDVMTTGWRCYCDEDRACDGADGVLTVSCDDGDYMVPYLSSGEVQAYRGKMHYNSTTEHLTDVMFDFIDRVVGLRDTLSWHRFRSFVNSIIK